MLPVITIDGGSSVITNDPTPTLAGTSDVAPGTVVRVSVDSQNLTALVQSDGTWNVTAAALSDGTRTVTAAVTDPAGNVGTDSQALTLDTVAPGLTVAGGANALTDLRTPDISGTADVAPGTTVTVTLADQTLTALVQSDGSWSVTAAALSDGPHRVAVSVPDAAGNVASCTQTLTVDTVPPFVAINGGATATTNSLTTTIAGTSDAAPGTTVTLSIAGQTMTTLVQPNGSWNATTVVAEGTWLVVASATDPAGNVGSARQVLVVATSAPSGSGRAGPTGGTGPTGCTGQTGAGPVLMVWLSATSFRAARGKPVQVPFVLSGAAKVTMNVSRAKRVVAVVSVACSKPGRCRITWNGRIKGKLAPTGTYNITVRAVSSAGASPRDAAKVHVT